jgi:hypothetical protein
MSDEELADLEENFPVQAALVREVRELRQKVTEHAPAPAPAPASTEWQAPTFEPEVQDVIDQVPQLQAWQFSQTDQDKFQLAATFDDALRKDPTWASKPAVERFAEPTPLTALTGPMPTQDKAMRKLRQQSTVDMPVVRVDELAKRPWRHRAGRLRARGQAARRHGRPQRLRPRRQPEVQHQGRRAGHGHHPGVRGRQDDAKRTRTACA